MNLKKIVTAFLAVCITAPLTVMPSASALGKGHGYRPPALTQGDANSDGTFNVADLVAFNKWLNSSSPYSSHLDLNNDGKLNVFDMCIMRKRLIDMGYDISAVNLSADVSSENTEGAVADSNFIYSQTKFALDLYKDVSKNEFGKEGYATNTLVSPYSVMQALAMTANGADGNTKREMENVLGNGMSIDKLNRYLYTQRISQPDTNYCKLSTANSIWSRDDSNRIKVFQSFLQRNADYYGADIFKAPFDMSTVTDINRWVKKNTDGMIPEIIQVLPADAVMCLVNAVAFDAKWDEPYDSNHTAEGMDFTDILGNVQSVEMMYSTENYFIEDSMATGFLKHYKGNRYAFAALLPNEGVNIADYISSLNPDTFHRTLANPSTEYDVYTSLPKFEYDFDTGLNQTLMNMGIQDAFNENAADFTRMAETATQKLYINSVLHKTHIEVGEEGTRAGAATAIIMGDDCATPSDYKEVYLDRPFVYCIVDLETSLPIFIGTFLTAM